MSLAGILDAIGGFSGGFANALQQNQGQNDLGNALATLYGGGSSGQGQGSSGGMGGGLMPLLQPSSSGQGGQNGAYSYQGQTATNLPSAGPTMGMGAGPLAAQVQAASVQPGTAQQGGGIGSAYAGQQQQQQPSTPQAAPQGQPPQSAQQPQPNPTAQGVQALGRGPLTLPDLVQAVMKVHPGIHGSALADAVGNPRALQFLSMEGLQQYRGIAEQLRMQNEQSLIEDRRDRSADRKQAERDRMQMSSDRINAATERQQTALKAKWDQFTQTMDFKKAKSLANDIKSAIKDRLEARNHEIQMQYSLPDDQKAELYKQAQSDAKLANDNLDKLLAEKGKSGEAGGKETGANNKENNAGAQAQTKTSDEQKAQWKKQAQDAIASGKDPAWIRNKYKELTGEDLGK